ncbi:MAG TPA: lysophospholipid acyltransferase family protein [Kineosporiaceae bacterium]|nr:lysophospholipid acyltransferase family protein [Kineosporiaceae bacterium]
MRDLVYPPITVFARGVFAALGLRFRLEGLDNIPTTGGVVLASNHVSYLDFAFLGLGTFRRGRLTRFMAKDSVFRHPVSGPLMRGMHHIAVDRNAGSQAFRDGLAMLKAGEILGVFPEATISRSFMLKELKPGAARMAQATGTPILPAAVWGGQRIYTKGRPKDFKGRGKTITVAYGEPLYPAKREKSEDVMAELRERMTALLDHVQGTYPDHPSGEDDRWWLPACLGGTAPTPEEAAAMDAADREAGRPGGTSDEPPGAAA